ncbi:hypothetical protein SMGD1_1583 [Sulfurimonas gotlandica GD1]|jgi:hypothetical protein|uniref:DUF3187 domain-containing protein n=1 Tax=Sulfurimonas gotlandica (strain DSM 19862 / JCM 16533 / GD1) TaxID=929558 RepID=B6BHV6_SULGG|nr:DUF3187 family protein [Sulfurimonas gotlandica]EDZ63775.1 hypothetical protein CBGD1_1395 [Sulfurimonas gotlandica GD1]EHP30107.1 hypothetical protein SMGD1_1583 [Sulfurimonas gotlandica GD1]
MTKILLVLLAISISLIAYSDYDMDGVDDKTDKCPNTPFSDLVNTSGCTVKSLESPHHFDIIFGINYSQTSYETLENSDTISQSLQIDYYYKNFSLQASTSYYNSQSATYNNSGTNDSFLGAYYKLNPADNLTLRLGAGAIIPTYKSDLNNNNTDLTASASLSYMMKNANIFGGYSYTVVNDDDIVAENVAYQNTSSYNFGLGFYPTSKIYISGAYNSSDSIYKNVETINTVSINAFYNIDAHWFTTLNYAYGLSDTASDNYASLRVGYYF